MSSLQEILQLSSTILQTRGTFECQGQGLEADFRDVLFKYQLTSPRGSGMYKAK